MQGNKEGRFPNRPRPEGRASARPVSEAWKDMRKHVPPTAVWKAPLPGSATPSNHGLMPALSVDLDVARTTLCGLSLMPR